MLDDAKLNIPKTRKRQQNPFLTEKQIVPAASNPSPLAIDGNNEVSDREDAADSKIAKVLPVEVRGVETAATADKTSEFPSYNQAATETPLPGSPSATRPRSGGPALAAIKTEFGAAPITHSKRSPALPSVPGGW